MQLNISDSESVADYGLVANIIDWCENRDEFIRNLRLFHVDTLKTYATLLGYFRTQNKSKFDDLPFVGDDLANLIEQNIDEFVKQPKSLDHLVDIIEILLQLDNANNFVEKCAKNCVETVHRQNENGIEVYFRVAARLNLILPDGIPASMQEAVIKSMHGKWTSDTIFTEALLLIDGALKKQGNATGDCIELLWRELCARHEHECDRCYAILAQFIEPIVSWCRLNSEFADKFLATEFWTIMRRGMTSSELLKRKQTNFVLHAVLQYVNEPNNEFAKYFIINHTGKDSIEAFASVWETYFILLDTLIDIQGHLIVSTLDRYLDKIVKLLPINWSSIIFALLFNHSVTSVIQYGISFAIDHKIHFNQDDDDDVNEMFYTAMNNIALYTGDNVSFVNKLSEYINCSENINCDVEMFAKIPWKSVPGWIMLRSLATALKKRDAAAQCVDVKSVLAFIETFIQTKKHKQLNGINDMIVDIIQSIGSNRFTVIQLLTLYEQTMHVAILEQVAQPLTIEIFTDELLPTKKLMPTTKVDYFIHALGNAERQSAFLATFYESKDENAYSISNHSDCEYILFASLCNEHGPLMGLQIFKPRLFELISNTKEVHADALFFGLDLMYFMMKRYLTSTDNSNAAVYESINGTFNIFHGIFRSRLFGGRTNSNETLLQQRIDLISAKLAMCTELHPNRMDVLAILSNAVVIEEYDLDLHRFDYRNPQDCELIQNILDWYMCAEAKSAKPMHRAKVIATIVKKFPNLRYDTLEVFPMLLTGKCDVKCVFDSTHPACTETFDTLLMDALMYGPELKGDERIEYQFMASIANGPTYVQQVRMAAMQFIRRNNSLQQIRDLKEALLAKSEEFYKIRYFNKSYHHSLKLRYTQAIAFLFHLDPIWNDETLQFVLNEANQTNVKYICELIVADTMNPKQLFPIIDTIKGNRGYASMFQIMYYICCKHNDREFAETSIKFLINYLFVKQISVRSAAQITLVKLCDKFNLMDSYPLIYNSIRSSLFVNSVPKFAKISYLSDLRTEHIDCQHLLHPSYVFYEIPRLTDMTTDEFYVHSKLHTDLQDIEIPVIPLQLSASTELLDIRDSDITFIEKIDDVALECDAQTSNVQKKMIPFRETFIDRQLINSLPVDFQHGMKNINSGLIIIASLVTKVPNVGGICRSSEVFGVSAVGIDNLQNIKRSEFTSLSMGSENWINFVEIKSHYLFSYLKAMKSRGYSIVGAEQTASGKFLHNTALPHKMILVLGHEKEGIPANIINLLDLAIEIPQFGVVRSLNVHVTSALFCWEYCKQHLIANADVSH